MTGPGRAEPSSARRHPFRCASCPLCSMFYPVLSVVSCCSVCSSPTTGRQARTQACASVLFKGRLLLCCSVVRRFARSLLYLDGAECDENNSLLGDEDCPFPVGRTRQQSLRTRRLDSRCVGRDHWQNSHRPLKPLVEVRVHRSCDYPSHPS